MSMTPQAQQKQEVDLRCCTLLCGIKGHEHVTYLIEIKSINLQKQYSKIKENKKSTKKTQSKILKNY